MNNKKKILIIEDEEILGTMLMRKISDEGYEVSLALDGEEGLALMKKNKPDLILLDIVMPKIDGFGVMHEMNKTENLNLNKMPVVIISNSGEPVEIDRILKLGVRDYLIKTQFNPEEVLEKVKKYL
ncbi:MAG: response regulator [Candidatus Pacebacteria bacterium]|nr:response regulator [Candidatus Paceibacterota bacterium]